MVVFMATVGGNGGGEDIEQAKVRTMTTEEKSVQGKALSGGNK